MQTILVVDDEPQIVQLVRDYLEHGGFNVLAAADGPAALRTAATQHPDLVVLDLGLPGLDGLDVTRSLRRNGAVPIIMLTARADESDKLVGLELGADDYLTKPFSPKELVARVRSVLRRSEAAREPADLIRAGDVELNIPSMADDRRAAGRVDAHRVPAGGDDGAPAGPRLQPSSAAECGSRGRVRVVRARHRCPHQEPSPQDGAGSA